MTYFAYLDEFGHIGPYVSRADPRYKESPVFGLAGFVLPAAEVRHGSSQTSAELYNPQTRDFMMRGQELSSVRQDYVEAAAGKVHGVVAAIELTAKVFGNAAVAMEARAARRALDLAASTTPPSKTE